MAKINTKRPEAATYNGQTVDFVRVVGPQDGPAFNEATPQLIVRYQGNELYFYADEVVLSDDEQDAVHQSLDKAKEAHDKAQEAGKRNEENKKKLLAGGDPAEAGAKKAEDERADGENDPANRIKAHEGISPAGIEAERNPQNRVPGTPPAASNPGTAPHGSPQEEPGEHREGRTPLDQLPGGLERQRPRASPPDEPKPLD